MISPQEAEQRSGNILDNSSFYQEFLAEREEILRHKWFQSEEAGQDVGFEKALFDWVRHHRADWKLARRQSLPLDQTDPREVFAKIRRSCV